ncbi:hypothetical protein NKDENANG_03118 [Candidatus Entotheonellaceae bacterium PAL068K]
MGGCIGGLKGEWVKALALNSEAFVLAILSVVLTWLPAFAPMQGLFLVALAPFPLVVLAVKYPWRLALWVAGLEVVGLGLLGGGQALLLFSQYGLVPLVIAWAVRQGYSIARTMIWSVVLPLGVGAVFLLLYSVVVRQSLFLLLSTYLEQVLEVVQDQLRMMAQTQEGGGEKFTAFAQALPRFVLTIFPALLVMNHLLTNVWNYILVRYYCSRGRPPIQLDPVDLTCWRASDYLVWVFLASGAASLVPLAPIGIVGLNVFLLTLAIYLLHGLAIAGFWGRRVPFPFGLRLLLALMIFLVAGPLCIMLCIAAGLFDLWIDFRRQRGQPVAS